MTNPSAPKERHGAPIAQRMRAFGRLRNAQTIPDVLGLVRRQRIADLRRLAGAVLVATSIGCIVPARADDVPGTAFSGRGIYYTTDMEPVLVHFAPEGRTVDQTRESPVVASGTVPRAYIFSASPYTSREFDTLPSEIWVRWLNLMVMSPGGEPYGIAYERFAHASRGLRNAEAKSALRSSLRQSHNISKIRTSNSNKLTEPYNFPGPTHVLLKKLNDNVSVYSRGNARVFLDKESPWMYFVQCSSEKEVSGPKQFCHYHIVLNDRLWAETHFVDFRFHGGWPFALERAAFVREKLCEFFDCVNRDRIGDQHKSTSGEDGNERTDAN